MKNKRTKEFNRAQQWQFIKLIEGKSYILPVYHIPVVDVTGMEYNQALPEGKCERVCEDLPSHSIIKTKDGSILMMVNSNKILKHLAKSRFRVSHIKLITGKKMQGKHLCRKNPLHNLGGILL